MKKILFSVAMAFVLVSCSHDEVIEINRDGDEIQFNVVSDAATRAADVYCNNNMPEQFRVWANHTNDQEWGGGAPYINGDLIVREGNAAPYTWKNSVATRYWPEGKVTFWAEVNAGNKFYWNAGDPSIVDYTVDTSVENQQDLLYAATCRTEEQGDVVLNFRHALSQIVFKAKNQNPNIHVVIDEVKICNLANKGTIHLNSATDGNIVNHDGNGATAENRNGWKVSYEDHTTLAGGNTDYGVAFDAVDVPGDGNPYSLTSTNDSGKEFSSKAMLLLPQTTTAWEPGTGNAVPEEQEGTYFLVKCKIYNVYDPENGYNSEYEGDVCLYDDYAAIPASFNWSEGKKYIYTFVFGDGNGGYDPTPEEDPDEPEPVLTPITFNVTVDDFVPVANQDITMETIE